MDQPDLDTARHAAALRGLARINRVSGSDRILWPPLAALARTLGGRPLRVLDVATGAGDVPIRLARRARRAGVALELAACDRSSTALDHARQSADRHSVSIRLFPIDALADSLPDGFDAVICSLFLHHLTAADAVSLLRRMADAAGRLVLVNDLRRSAGGLLLAHLACRLLTRSPVVHTDGPRSVAAAFTPAELAGLAADAGLAGAAVARRWPCRMLLSWHRPTPPR
jgi:SAM-dependent methyltransferase